MACVQIGSRAFHVICVDNIVPRHVSARHGTHPRLVYVDGEVAHFEIERHRYALVPAEPPEGTHTENGAGRGVGNGRDGNPSSAPTDIRDLLTNREMQIVQLICLGCLTKQVADRLRLSEFTVRSYLKTIYCKLGVRSRGAMVFRYAQTFSRLPPDA